ncbi:MAG: polysaccharide biosynthesis protein [Clostridia bacterium]|nr:polysaccharide biosynthesis protein [Clostridia bacterium]
MKKSENGLIKGAFFLSIGGFITKAIGAIYRIPLTNLLGAEGIGLYQMVFPLYSLLLTVSSTGVPNGMAKLIAEKNDENKVLKSALCFFVPLGLLATVFLIVFGYHLAVLQGNSLAKSCYVAIAPSVLLVSVISCFRGYFQGKLDMKPTAISQILEQVIKLIFGLTLCYVFKENVVIGASVAALAVSISELVTVLYFIFLKKYKGGGFNGFLKVNIDVKLILKTVLPVMLCTLILPSARTIESFLIVNILNKNFRNATSLYGLYSGAVESLVGVPVALLYGIAVSSVPVIASKKKEGLNYKKKIVESLALTIVFSLLFSVAFFFLSRFAVDLLYRRFDTLEVETTVKMLKIASLSVFFLPLMQTSASILISLGRYYIPTISSVIAMIIKIPLSIFLLNLPSVNIFAVVITDIVCYLVACFINLVYIIKDGASNKHIKPALT